MLTDTALLVGSIAGVMTGAGYLWLWPRQYAPPAIDLTEPTPTLGAQQQEKEPIPSPSTSQRAVSDTAQKADDPFLRGAAKLDRLIVDAMDAMTAIEREVRG